MSNYPPTEGDAALSTTFLFIISKTTTNIKCKIGLWNEKQTKLRFKIKGDEPYEVTDKEPKWLFVLSKNCSKFNIVEQWRIRKIFFYRIIFLERVELFCIKSIFLVEIQKILFQRQTLFTETNKVLYLRSHLFKWEQLKPMKLSKILCGHIFVIVCFCLIRPRLKKT